MTIRPGTTAGRNSESLLLNSMPTPPGRASVSSNVDSLRVQEPNIICTSQAMREVRTHAQRVAAGEAKVLITGESGVGKDIIARYIYANSSRANRPFIAVNCAALTESLLESELFGHVKGSFTGAYREKVGKLQLAHKGTIFLDEIGEMSVRMQALLLRFLENGEIQPVGADTASTKVDVRVISATNRDLAAMIAAGQFREDLLYRIKVVHIHVPPLRERRDDIRALVDHTIEQSRQPIEFTEEAMQALERYRWPGNVRQLQNIVEQLVWMSTNSVITLDDLPGAIRNPATSGPMPARERRRQVADDLYAGLVSGVYAFWEHTYTLFLNRDITRHDLRELVKRGLATTCGNYRALVKLFGMKERDYKRFLNFLASHDCCVDFREFRTGKNHEPAPRTTSLPGKVARVSPRRRRSAEAVAAE